MYLIAFTNIWNIGIFINNLSLKSSDLTTRLCMRVNLNFESRKQPFCFISRRHDLLKNQMAEFYLQFIKFNKNVKRNCNVYFLLIKIESKSICVFPIVLKWSSDDHLNYLIVMEENI